jgi:glycosyltransferase involved in cell wall biosynthesis
MVTTVCHVVDLTVGNPWLNGVATHHDRSRFRHIVVTLGGRSVLHDGVEGRGVCAFALDARGRKGYPRAVARLAALVRRESVDIVQTHLFEPSLVGLLAGRIGRTRAVLVTRHHADFTTIFNKPVHRWLDRQQALRADLVLAASEAVRRSMIDLEGVPADHITVHRYGYEFDELRPRLTSEERQQLRQELGADATGPLIAVIARLSIEKGHRYLLEALPPLTERWPGLRVALCGTGPLRAELEAAVQSSDLGGCVTFLGWRDDAHRVMEAADVVVHPTLHEAFCSVIIEAMALERPLVATNVAAAPEQVDDGATGILVPPRDPVAITRAIESVLVDPEWAAAMGVEARRRVIDRFDFPRMMRLYEQTYEEVLTRGGRVTPR